MPRRSLVPIFLAALGLILAAQAWPYPEFARQTKSTCATCHGSPAGGPELTEPGKMFKADRKKVPTKQVIGADYVGNERCGACHIGEHTSWGETRHAHALEMLKAAPDSAVAKMAAALKVKLKAPPAETDACVVCHVTGFKLPGGYPNADSLRNAAVASVSCESCHGPGSRHVTAPASLKKQMIHAKVSANTCTQCHTRATSPKFDFEEYKKRGVHDLNTIE